MLPHVLVLEDDVEISQVLCDHLAEHGYRCTTATTAEEARSIMAVFPVDVVIADIALPGSETGAVIVAEAQQRGIPAMIVTGQDWYEEDGIPVLRKPVRLGALLETMERLIQGRALTGAD